MSPLLVALSMFASGASAQTANLYTKPAPDATGGISGRTNQELTHAIALSRDRVACYRGILGEGGKSFRCSGLPTGKYDLVLVGKNNVCYEGLGLGEAPNLTGTPAKNLETRVSKADKFFNKAQIHRFGMIEDGGKILALVERIRDQLILKQSGETLNSNLRRFEVIDLEKAADDWTITTSRHIYREEAPVGAGMAFCKHSFVAELGNVRVIDTGKELGTLTLPAR